MYRAVIEHPQWIPWTGRRKWTCGPAMTWGASIGSSPSAANRGRFRDWTRLDTAGLVAALDRRTAGNATWLMMLCWRNDPTAANPLMLLALNSKRPETRVQALCALDAIHSHILMAMTIKRAFLDPHPAVRRHAIRIWEGRMSTSSFVCDEMAKLVTDPDPQVRMQLAFTLGEWKDNRAGELLGKLAVASADDTYMLAAVMTSVTKDNFDGVIAGVMTSSPPPKLIAALLRGTGFPRKSAVTTLLAALAKPTDGRYGLDQIQSLADVLDAVYVPPGIRPDRDMLQQVTAVFSYATRC